MCPAALLALPPPPPPGQVLDFIQHYAAKILYHPAHSHASFLADPAWQQQLVADVAAMAGAGTRCGAVGGGVQAAQRRGRVRRFASYHVTLAPGLNVVCCHC